MINSLPQIVILLFSIIFHEVAHGRIALLRGDTTARDAGRLTFNPIPHIDIFGTILFPLFLIVMRSSVLFGWAKPVPVTPWRLKEAKKDMALVGAAGPASNFLLALVAGMLFRWAAGVFGGQHALTQALFFAVLINLVLTFFNLIPIPPLDGSRIVMGFLPHELAMQYVKIERYGFIILFAFFFLGLFQRIIFPFVNFFLKLIVGISLF